MAESELMQGTLDLPILGSLALQPMHGMGIFRRISQITNGAFDVSLFPALHRMEQAGWLASTAENVGCGMSPEGALQKARRDLGGMEQVKESVSNAQRLPNGNTPIDEGMCGRFFEVTSAGEVVWEYVNPHFGPASRPPTNTDEQRLSRVSVHGRGGCAGAECSLTN
jgi:hypothetical protein